MADNRETYRGSIVEVHTSTVASGRVSFVVNIDGKIADVDVDGPDPSEAKAIAMGRAKRKIDSLHDTSQDD